MIFSLFADSTIVCTNRCSSGLTSGSSIIFLDNYKFMYFVFQHSIDCGGGTGIFLVVTSTYIIIVRGRRACLWGSLYLDDYDEEDRDLK